MTTILAPVDGSARAELALTPLPHLARALDAGIALLIAEADPAEAAQRAYLAGLADRYHLGGPGSVDLRVDPRAPAAAIVGALDADPTLLLWLPTHARTGAALRALGEGVVEAVIGATDRALLAAGPHLDPAWTPARGGPIVLAYDGSPGADRAADDAAAWARRLGTAMVVTVAVHHDGAYLGDRPATAARKAAHALVERLEAGGTHAALHVVDGLNPATAIPRHAAAVDAPLIVAAAHTHHGLVHAALGSVAVRMVRHATCPVLVRPTPVDAPAATGTAGTAGAGAEAAGTAGAERRHEPERRADTDRRTAAHGDGPGPGP